MYARPGGRQAGQGISTRRRESAGNETWLPESTRLPYNWLRGRNGRDLYRRHVIPNYGHIDCIFGQNAVADACPFILGHLEATA